MTWAFLFGLTLFSFIPSWAREFTWHDFLSNQPIGLSLLSFFLPQAFMAHLLLSCSAFTSYCACGHVCCHFLPCWPTRLYFFLSFLFELLWPICFYFALFLPFIVPVGLFATIFCHTSSLGFIYLFLSSLGFYGPFVSILLCF